MTVVLIVILALIVIAVIYVIATFNSLIRLQNRADEGFSDIDVQLKRRHDLIPNLVETVKGYAAHERQVLENVARNWKRDDVDTMVEYSPLIEVTV